MALSGSVLANLIKTNMAAEFGAPVDDDLALKAAKVIADAVVQHITTAGVVSVTSTVNPLGLIAPNGPVTGTATATGTGTIS